MIWVDGAREEDSIQSFSSLPKYQGETTELVGSKRDEPSCCILS